MEHRPKKRLGHGGDAICLKHYSIRTKKASVTWMKPYIFFHTTRHPNDMARATIEALLMHLASQQKMWLRRPKIKRSTPCCFGIAKCSKRRSIPHRCHP